MRVRAVRTLLVLGVLVTVAWVLRAMRGGPAPALDKAPQPSKPWPPLPLRPEEQAVAAAGTSPITDTGTMAERPHDAEPEVEVEVEPEIEVEVDTADAGPETEVVAAVAGSEADPSWRAQVGEALPQLIETPAELEPDQQDIPVGQQADGPVWVEPIDGECPTTHPVKAKLGSGIYHAPGGLNYDRTRPDRCYLTTEAAELDGLRRSKR